MDKQHQWILLDSYHTKYHYVLSPMQSFTPLPSEQQRLGIHNDTENESGVGGHFPKSPRGCGGAAEEAAGGSWMWLWWPAELAASGNARLGSLERLPVVRLSSTGPWGAVG